MKFQLNFNKIISEIINMKEIFIEMYHYSCIQINNVNTDKLRIKKN